MSKLPPVLQKLPFTVIERELLIKDETGADIAVPALPVLWDIEEDAHAAAVRLVTSG